MTTATAQTTLTDHTTVPTINPEMTTMTTSTKTKTTSKKKTAAKEDRPSDMTQEGDSTATDVAFPATDTAVDVSPVLPVADTLPTPPIDQTATDEAPATPPADVTPGVEDLAARIITGDADVAAKVQYLTGIVRQGDAAIAAAIEVGIIRIGSEPVTPRARGTHGNGTKGVPVACGHCGKHFLGRPSQLECRVCSDYKKAHNGQERPLAGTSTKTVKTPVTPPPAATRKAASTKKKRNTKTDNHRPH